MVEIGVRILVNMRKKEEKKREEKRREKKREGLFLNSHELGCLESERTEAM